MVRIDTHVHFWKYNPLRDAWITDEMEVIRRNWMPEDVLEHLKKHKIEGLVAVQVDQSEDENSFLVGLAENYSFIKGVVGWVNFEAENISERLAYYQDFPDLKGFRHILQAEKDRAFMLRPNFRRGIQELQRVGYTYDILIFPDQLKFSRELVASFPNQPFVLDHIAKPLIKEGEIESWAQEIKELSKHENVWCKVSGLVTEADWKNWSYEDFVSYLEVVVEAFGVQRLMYGSDWPVCKLAGGYDASFSIVHKYFSSFSKDEQALLYGGNAMKFYKLNV